MNDGRAGRLNVSELLLVSIGVSKEAQWVASNLLILISEQIEKSVNGGRDEGNYIILVTDKGSVWDIS